MAFDLEGSLPSATRCTATYKGTRKPMPQELHEQVPLMQEGAFTAMGVPILTMARLREADDILGTVAKRCQAEG